MPTGAQELRFLATRSSGEVTALWRVPEDPRAVLVLAHGAGAGIRHPSLGRLSLALSQARLATLRYHFPYMEAGRRRPDPPPVLMKTVRSAVDLARRLAPETPLFAGGRSMGGRMTSLAASREPLPGVSGLAFFAFPLHPAGRPGTERARHLDDVGVPMLFLQGTRDRLAELALLTPVCRRLGRRATLHLVEGADHSFHLPKRLGRTDEAVTEELVAVVARWIGGVTA